VVRVEGASKPLKGQILFGFQIAPILTYEVDLRSICSPGVYQGILGYGANRRMHKDSALHLSHDHRMMLSVVDTEEKLRAYFPILDQMVQQGLVVLSDVDVIKYTHNFAGADRRQEART
jgi:PII-like signaling protein